MGDGKNEEVQAWKIVMEKEGLKTSRKNESDLSNYDVSVGNIDKSKGEYPVKKTGIKIRGTGAATKGVMARGPMA